MDIPSTFTTLFIITLHLNSMTLNYLLLFNKQMSLLDEQAKRELRDNEKNCTFVNVWV